MNKKIISTNSYFETFSQIIKVIKSRKIDLEIKHILIVPDKYTLIAEKKLFENSRGAFDCEVMTFNRLFSKMVDCKNYLPRQGAIMLISNVIKKISSQLVCFNKSIEFKGFSEKIYDTVCQFASCKISPEEIVITNGALGKKLQDIKLIYAAYNEEILNRYIDSNGRMDLLLSEIETNSFLDNMHVYIANFDAYTVQGLNLLKALENRALSITIGEVAPLSEYYLDAEVELYSAANTILELKAVAKRIRNNVYCGMRYSEIALVWATTNFEQIKRIFNEYEIPFYIDKKINLEEHALSKFLLLLLEAVTKKYRRKTMLAVVKNFYFDESKFDCDAFCNYCDKFSIDYLAFTKPFTYCDTEQKNGQEARTAAERIRASLMKILQPLAFEVDKISNAEQFNNCINGLIVTQGLKEKTEKLTLIGGKDWSQVCDKAAGVSQLVAEVFGKNNVELERLIEAFKEGLSTTEISLIPSRSDSVFIGDVDMFRGQTFRQLYIIGCNDGTLPKADFDCGIITDGEIDDLCETKINLEPKIATVNQRNREQFYQLLKCAPNIFISFSEGGDSDSRPSMILKEVEKHAKKVWVNSYEKELITLGNTHNKELVARHCSGFYSGLEMLITNVSEFRKSEKMMPFISSLYHALGGKRVDKYLNDSVNIYERLPNAAQLFFKNESTKVSQIEAYFKCPYLHFMQYGLCLKEREIGGLRPTDIGILLHKVVEEFVASGQFDDIVGAVKVSLDKELESKSKYRTEANEAVIRRLYKEAVVICGIISEQLKGSLFVSRGQEMRFGFNKNSDFETVEVDACGKKIKLSGVIDRVDTYGDFARVIDYKTGQVKFSFSDLYYGKKVQLTLYMYVLEHCGFQPAGMFYFPFSDEWTDDQYSHRLIGIFNNSLEIVSAMDTSVACGGVSKIIPATVFIKSENLKAGKEIYQLKGSSSKLAFDTEELKKIIKYSFLVIEQAVKEIMSGYINPSPTDKGCACDYCAYSSICSFDGAKDLRRLLTVDGAAILECVNKAEGESYGGI